MNQSRRNFIKLLASAPLALSSGLVGEALMRYSKPSMSPFGFFDQADLPDSTRTNFFMSQDFPSPWTCIPFLYEMRIKVFSPEKYDVRPIPAFAIRLNSSEIVAYSRQCQNGSGLLEFVANANKHDCTCLGCSNNCSCVGKIKTPVLVCPYDGSVFDLSNNAQVVCGPAKRPPRRFDLEFKGRKIIISGIGSGCIH